jgi:PAS domain S-box-containing protein/putative nucleotidyltransferase with HDIG domain
LALHSPQGQFAGQRLGGKDDLIDAPLRILYVEDNNDDALIVAANLRRAGYEPMVARVDTAAAMAAALAERPWDVVLSDYSMPSFKAPEALQVLHASGQDLPFIIVSGTIQEEDAVAALRAGAHDFIVKDRLSRLAPAIARELRDAEGRAARRREQAAAQELESSYRLLFANSPLPMWMYDPHSLQFVEVNDAAIAVYGYSREEFLRMRIADIRPPEDLAALERSLAANRSDFRPSQSWRHVWKDGSLREVEVAAHSLTIGGRALTLVVAHDVTERRQHERELETVAAISAALRTAQTLDELLAGWLDQTLAAMNATGGSIWLHDAPTNSLRPALLRGWQPLAGPAPAAAAGANVGIAGYVFTTRQPYVSANFDGDPRASGRWRAQMPTGGGAGIPIPVGNEVIGTFVVNIPLGRTLSEADIHLLSTLAEIAGSAIQRTRFLEQMQQRLSQLDALRAIDQAITSSLDLNLTLTVFLEKVVTQLQVDAADVLLLEGGEQMLRYAAGRGFRTREFQQVRTRVGEGRAGRAVLERRIIVSDMNDLHAGSKRTGQLGGEGFVSYVGVPLMAKGQVLGALEIFHRSPLQAAPEWMSFLTALAGQAALALDNAALFSGLQRSNTDLQLAYDATIEGWSRALDLRDKETEGHSQRVTRLSELLAAALGLPDDQMVQIRRGALLHDIGKMGVPDHILMKPGPLSDDEWAIMRQHPTFAYEMLAPIRYLRQALVIPYCHHEKWDGTGYPRGIKGEQIPLPARIFAVVDVWDALCSDRPYRRAWPVEKVREYLHAQSGSHFDPQVVEAFLQLDLRQT